MTGRISKLLVLITAAVLLISVSAYAFEAVGIDGTTVRNSANMGTVGTINNPIKAVDGTEVEFSSWAKGKYFTPDCTFENITAGSDTFTLMPVYEPEACSVTINAGGGLFGTEPSVEKEVNFDNQTIDTDLENVDKVDTKDLSAVLGGLAPTSSDTTLIPFYYNFEDSVINRRIFVDENDQEKKETDDTDIASAVYDAADGKTLTLVWKDCANAAEWNESQSALAYITAVEGSLSEDEYHRLFGGDSTVPYGSISIEKRLPGALINSCSWSLKKTNNVTVTGTEATFSYTGMNAAFDHAKLKEVISYGSKPYTLETAELELITYQRPTVGGEMIK